jgi:zinc/manganese transport system substrate-binding protein
MKSIGTRLAAVAMVTALVAAGCGGGTESEDDAGLLVVATTTMLGDLAVNIVGDGGTVEVLLPVGADPHAYQASARQAATLGQADLVIANGLGLEEGLHDVLEAAADDGARIVEVAERLNPIPFAPSEHDEHEHGHEGTHDHEDQGDHEHEDEGDHEHEDEGDHEHGDFDPHVWLDPLRMAEAARLIAAELEEIDPEGGWSDRAEAYAAELLAADEEIREILSVVVPGHRQLVTNHHALGYFADRYGFEVIGVVIPGGSTLAEPSSAELAALVAEIEEEAVTAIFAETTEPSALAEAVAAEVGYEVAVVGLYTGSLGEPGSEADSLIGMLLSNAELIAEALS